MNPDQIARINALARKSREEGLTPEELAEQAGLRRAYIDSVKASLEPQLENIRYVDEAGNRFMPDGTPDPTFVDPRHEA